MYKRQVNEPDEYDFENQSTIEQIPIINQNTRTFGVSWKRIYKQNNGFFNLSLSTNRLKNDFERFQDNVNKSYKVYSNISLEEETKLRFISSQNFNDYKFSIGGNIQYSNYSNNTLYPFYEINYNTSVDLIKYGFFAKSNRRFFNDTATTEIYTRSIVGSVRCV